MEVPASLLINGLFRSRFSRIEPEIELEKSLLKFKKSNPKNEVIVSTYRMEVPEKFQNLIDTLIIVDDPGQDKYSYFPPPIRNKKTMNEVNFSRMATTAIAGLQEAKNEFVIRTRIELIPYDFSKFEKWYLNQTNKLYHPKSIGFFYEFYSGIIFSIDGVLGNIPDVMQIGRKETLVDLWSDAFNFWKKNVLALNEYSYPITSDQCLGLNYLNRNINPDLLAKDRSVKRYTTNLSLIKAVKQAENDYFKLSSYRESGFSVNYFKGSYGIRPHQLRNYGFIRLLPLMTLVIIKRVKLYLKRHLKARRNN